MMALPWSGHHAPARDRRRLAAAAARVRLHRCRSGPGACRAQQEL